MNPSAPVPAVGAVCMRAGGDGLEVLLIRRGRPPRAGQWSLPGGRIESGEPAAQACLRELREETAVEAEILGLVDVVDGIFDGEAGAPASHYVLIDYAVRWRSGTPTPGDDAAAAAFLTLDAALAAVDWSQTRRVITEAAARFGAQILEGGSEA